MSENAQPDPEKAKADAAPKVSSPFSGSGGPRASAYVPLPEAAPRSRLKLALAALAAAGVLAGGAVWFRAPSGPSPVPIAAENRKVLWVADADVNAEATERLRRSAAPAVEAADSDRSPAGTMGSGDAGVPRAPPTAAAQIAAPPAPAVETRAAAPLPVVPPELMNPAAEAPRSVLTPQGAAAVRSDGWTVFQMRMLDDVDQDGDVVQVSVDGVPVSFLSLTHAGATLEIPLKKGESHTITLTAVKDGVGGITLGMSTSVGDITSRRMAVGESETWTIGFK